MKILLIIPALLALCGASCRTARPIDPHTFKPSDRCMPENTQPSAGGGPYGSSK
jgi:hypothetical protein